MAKRSSWSNTGSLYRFLEKGSVVDKKSGQTKKVKICFESDSRDTLISADGFILAHTSTYLSFQEYASPISQRIYLDDIKEVKILS